MSAQNEGGPAFPAHDASTVTAEGYIYSGQAGMTLRDYFAAKALTGLLASDEQLALMSESAEKAGIGFDEIVAGAAYRFADAMLAARVRGSQP